VRTIVTDGQGVQTVTVEPEWDEQERGYMTALSAFEDSLCPVCGGPPEECQTPEAERRWTGTPPTRCHRTDAVLRFQEKGTYERARALTWHAEERG